MPTTDFVKHKLLVCAGTGRKLESLRYNGGVHVIMGATISHKPAHHLGS